MVRVLHLMGQSPDFQTRRCSTILAQKLDGGINVTTRTIGLGGTHRNALSACLALRRDWEDFDLTHVWGLQALLVAAYAGVRRLVFTPGEFPSRRLLRKIETLMVTRDVHLVCASKLERQFYVENGLLEGRCHCIPPGVDVSRPMNPRDTELRRALGFAGDDYVLLAPGESSRSAGHRDAVWAASVLHVLDRRYKILLCGRGEQTGNCARLSEKLHQSALLALAEQKLGRRVEFDELLPAADAVLFAPASPNPVLPIAMCMGAGLPIISTPTSWLGDILKDGENCIQVPRRSSRMLAQRVMEMHEDSGLASRISGAARKTAGEVFSESGFIQGYEALYRKFA